MKLKISVLILTLLPLATQGQQKSELPLPASMEQCVHYALDHNLSVVISQKETESTKLDKTAAFGAFLPSVNASSSFSYNQGFSFDANTNQRTNQEQSNMSVGAYAQLNLFNGFEDINSYRRAQLAYSARLYSNDKIINDISLNVVNAYIGILASLEYQKITHSQYQLSQMQVNRIQKLVDAGKKAQGDLYDVQATLARDEQAMIDASNQVSLAYLSLKQLLALDMNFDLQIQTEGFEVTTTSSILNENSSLIYQSALANMPEIAKAKTDMDISKKSLNIAKGQYLPTLSMSYGWSNSFIFNYKNYLTGEPISTGDQWGNNSRQNIGLSLSIPIFNKLSAFTSVRRAKVNLAISELNLSQAQLTLQQNIEKAYTDAMSSYKSYAASQKAVLASTEALRSATDKFEVGKINVFDYESAKNMLFKSQADLLRSKYDYIFKSKLLEFYKTQKIVF